MGRHLIAVVLLPHRFCPVGSREETPRTTKKEARRKVSKKYYDKNRKKIIAYSKQWAQKFYKTEEGKKRKALYSIKDRIGKDGKTKPHILARAKKYVYKKRKIDVDFRIREQLRGRIYKAVKSNKAEKWGTT